MKSLVITAHPSSKGFVHQIAETYKKTRESKEGEAFLVNLYRDSKYQQPFLSFEEMGGDWSGDQVRQLIQEKITWADELVFVYPIWWMNMPAIMKNFIDNNFTSGFAFRYENGKPIGLLTDKTVRLLATADGPGFFYFFLKPLLRPIFGKAIFGFCGMKLRSFDIFHNMIGRRKEGRTEEVLEKVKKKIN